MDITFNTVIYILLALVAIISLYPFLNIAAIAFNDATDSLRGGVYIWPREPTMQNIRSIFALPQLSTAAVNTVLRTVTGSVCSVISLTMVAYVLSRKELIGRKFFVCLFLIPMYVNGGLIPNYFVIRSLGLLNTFAVYIIPMLLQPFYLFLIRNYIAGIPESLIESAKLDGANDLRVFFNIVIPLSIPVISTIFLFTAVDQWNAWFDNFIYNSNLSLTTLQFELVKLLNRSLSSVSSYEDVRNQLSNSKAAITTPQSIRMAITVVVTVPILLVYPFVQKYFVQGLTQGAVKE